MSVYGYCRISTPQQNIERQVRNITAAYPAAHIVREVYPGTACRGRQELDKLLHNELCPANDGDEKQDLSLRLKQKLQPRRKETDDNEK